MIHEPESKKIPITNDAPESLLYPMSLALTGFFFGFTWARGQGSLILTHLMQIASHLVKMLLIALHHSIKTQTARYISPLQTSGEHPHTSQYSVIS